MPKRDGTTETLELRVAEVERLFDSMDPAPFRERDLDPRAEKFIVEWASELRSGVSPALEVRIERGARPEDAALVQQAVSAFFHDRARASRYALHKLLRNGRISLAIGLGFVAAALVVGDLMGGFRFAIVSESVVIGAWVALWRPLDIFLYDWWPIRSEARLYERLAAAPVEVVSGGASATPAGDGAR